MLQLALATAVIANDGVKMKPHLVREVVDVVTRASRETLKEIKAESIAGPENIAVIKRALVGVNTEGTGATGVPRRALRGRGQDRHSPGGHQTERKIQRRAHG